ncbi:hypothetical protein [Conchiformibius kuhniae]|uniref:Uncharacterized protein n=1 Tax=Conchiformibius kuhniae TaxID=211502 RepID=A0A8T9MSZ0_9NEIS|nr:hypothetical protein [Conchiformibius kuhniae]UOP04369.1 hypothetical protein LVJ77_08495 [Conchiformibius kuhniae]
MLWEFLATLFAGLGAAGVVLLLRPLVRGRMPKWAVPAAAGLGMLGFQVYSEYTWFAHTRAKLPPDTVVVAEVPSAAPYKPWSYVVPQVLQFVAADTANVRTDNSARHVNLYFFERRMRAKVLAVRVDCATGHYSDPQSGQVWQFDQRLRQAVCGKSR